MRTGREALSASKYPLIVLEAMLQFSQMTGIAIFSRVGNPSNVGPDIGFYTATKSIDTKTKTTNPAPNGPDFAAGFIPWLQNIFGRDHKPIHLTEDFTTTQLYVSLREILLADLAVNKNGAYIIQKTSPEKLEFIAPNSITGQKSGISYALDLKQGIPPIPYTEEEAKQLAQYINKQEIKQPAWWDESYGSFAEKLAANTLYPISFSGAGYESEPFMVLADKAGHPVTGDIDTFAFAIPLDKQNPRYMKIWNGGSAEGKKELIECFHLLCAEYKLTNIDWINSIEEYVKKVGNITPYEFFANRFINNIISHSCLHLYTKNFLQHGPDSGTPGLPSEIKDIFVTHNGRFLLPNTEDELIEVISRMTDQGMYLRIHPKWNMEKWATVVQKQLKLNLPVEQETIANYREFEKQYIAMHGPHMPFPQPIATIPHLPEAHDLLGAFAPPSRFIEIPQEVVAQQISPASLGIVASMFERVKGWAFNLLYPASTTSNPFVHEEVVPQPAQASVSLVERARNIIVPMVTEVLYPQPLAEQEPLVVQQLEEFVALQQPSVASLPRSAAPRSAMPSRVTDLTHAKLQPAKLHKIGKEEEESIEEIHLEMRHSYDTSDIISYLRDNEASSVAIEMPMSPDDKPSFVAIDIPTAKETMHVTPAETSSLSSYLSWPMKMVSSFWQRERSTQQPASTSQTAMRSDRVMDV